MRCDLNDLKQRAQSAAGDLAGAGNEAVGLVHRHHHRAVVIRVEHGLPGLLDLDAFVAPQQFVAQREILQVFAFGRVDDAHPFERDVQPLGCDLNRGAIPEQHWRSQSQRIELPRRLQNARLGPFRDGRAAFVGSQSLRRLELEKRREVGILIHDSNIVREMKNTFDGDWAETPSGKKGAKKAMKAEKADKLGQTNFSALILH